MDLKKSEKADLEWRKPIFIQIGLVISLLMVFLALELVGSREKSEVVFANREQVFSDEVVLQTKQEQETQPPPPQQQQIAISLIEVVANNIKLEDFTVDMESTTDLVTEEIYGIEDTKVEVVVEAEIFVIVEILPEYPGGDEARIRFLQENLVYPKFAREAQLEGKVYIGFVVEPDGRLTNFSVVRSVAPILDEEAMRVVKMMPKWNPGKQRGRAVRVQFQVPITFTLN